MKEETGGQASGCTSRNKGKPKTDGRPDEVSLRAVNNVFRLSPARQRGRTAGKQKTGSKRGQQVLIPKYTVFHTCLTTCELGPQRAAETSSKNSPVTTCGADGIWALFNVETLKIWQRFCERETTCGKGTVQRGLPGVSAKRWTRSFLQKKTRKWPIGQLLKMRPAGKYCAGIVKPCDRGKK